jgi:hypothetical protein
VGVRDDQVQFTCKKRAREMRRDGDLPLDRIAQRAEVGQWQELDRSPAGAEAAAGPVCVYWAHRHHSDQSVTVHHLRAALRLQSQALNTLAGCDTEMPTLVCQV